MRYLRFLELNKVRYLPLLSSFMEYFLEGNTIECNKCKVISKKISPSSVQTDPNIGDHMKYNCTRNSEAEIVEELDPKKAIYKKDSKLDLGDKIKAENITILTKQLRPIKLNIVNFSHRHKSQEAILQAYTVGQIKYPFNHILRAIEKRNRLKK
jgi:hypothetical protein